MHTFIAGFLGALLGVILFWGVTYLIIIKRRKIKTRNWVAVIHIAAICSIISIAFGPVGKMSPDESSTMLVVSLILSIISCHIFKAQELRAQTTTELNHATPPQLLKPNNSNKKPSGWLRLGIVISGLYAVLVAFIAYDKMPSANKIYASWFFEASNIIATETSMRRNNHVSFFEVQEKYLSKGPEENIKWLHQVAKINPDKLKIIPERINAINLKNEDRLENLSRDKFKHWLFAFFCWAGGTAILFALGAAISWVYRGFKQPHM